MHLEHISIINFRNFKEFEYEACRRINCFAGKNGVGKTTILDAIHYLSFSKSFLNTSDKLNISHGEEMFLIQGNFERKNSKELIYCGLKAGQKKTFKRNGKNYDKISDHIGFIPVISLLPSDGNLVFSSGDLRRKFIDMVIAQFDNNYLNDLIHYNRALEHRNKLLKQDNIDIESIEIWDEVLASKSIEIHKARKNFIDGFLESFKNYFKIISKEKEEVSLVYESHISNEHPLNLLRKNFERDRILKHTTTGIHRDDFIFILNNHLLKNIGSQGQQKSYISALKFAQFDFIKSKTNLEPILLLDDVFDKLDAERVELIMKIVSQSDFGQTFITDTDENRLNEMIKNIDIESKMIKL